MQHRQPARTGQPDTIANARSSSIRPASTPAREIELARVGEHTPVVHTDVRERILPEQTVYAGVFPQLDEGNFTLLDTDRQPQANLTITSGHVTNITLPS